MYIPKINHKQYNEYFINEGSIADVSECTSKKNTYSAIVITNLSKSGIKVFAFESISMNKGTLAFLAHSKRRTINPFKPSLPKRHAFEDMAALYSER